MDADLTPVLEALAALTQEAAEAAKDRELIAGGINSVITLIQRGHEEKAWSEDARAMTVALIPIRNPRDETIVEIAASLADGLAKARATRLARAATAKVDDLLSTVVANGENLRRNVECTTYDRPCPVCDATTGELCKTKAAGGFWLAGTAHEGR